jgi:phosphoribosylformylglycinamidine synthase I
MKKKPRICILFTAGTNCDEETAHAFRLAGGDPHRVHVSELRAGSQKLQDFQILALSGGFSYGDDIASGKVLAIELVHASFADQLRAFVEAGKPIIGICNGFQVLVRSGLLPFRNLGRMDATLAHNDSGKFQCQPTRLRVEVSKCIWTTELPQLELELPMAHGEGNYFMEPASLVQLNASGQVVLRYVNEAGELQAPNGSLESIAGICDSTGTIFGLMPHPERFVERTQHQNWRRHNLPPHGLPIFERGVAYAAGM